MSRRYSTEAPADAPAPQRHPQAPAPGTPISSHYAQCFGCGADHPAGLHLRVVAGDGVSVQAVLDVGEHHQGAPGLAHGGLLAAAFDEAMGYVNWLVRVPAVTGRLETTFLRPVPVGSRLYLDARATGVDGRRVFIQAEGRLANPLGQVAVTAAAVFVQVPLEHFAKNGRERDVTAAAAAARADGAVRVYEVNP